MVVIHYTTQQDATEHDFKIQPSAGEPTIDLKIDLKISTGKSSDDLILKNITVEDNESILTKQEINTENVSSPQNNSLTCDLPRTNFMIEQDVGDLNTVSDCKKCFDSDEWCPIGTKEGQCSENKYYNAKITIETCPTKNISCEETNSSEDKFESLESNNLQESSNLPSASESEGQDNTHTEEELQPSNTEDSMLEDYIFHLSDV